MSELKEAAEYKLGQMKKLGKIADDGDSGSSDDDEGDMASRNIHPVDNDSSVSPDAATANEPPSPMPNLAVRLAPLNSVPTGRRHFEYASFLCLRVPCANLMQVLLKQRCQYQYQRRRAE